MIFEDRLKKIHLNLEKEGVKANCLLLDGPTVENILKEAKKFKSDLIVIGSHKHGKFHHLLLGSIHESLISHSPIPIMIIPPLKEK
jgi:nucleotide-binding universal stress UspA family protein